MNSSLLLLIIFITFLLLLILNMPIALCLGWATLIYFLIIPNKKFLLMLPSNMYGGVDSFVLVDDATFQAVNGQ